MGKRSWVHRGSSGGVGPSQTPRVSLPGSHEVPVLFLFLPPPSSPQMASAQPPLCPSGFNPNCEPQLVIPGPLTSTCPSRLSPRTTTHQPAFCPYEGPARQGTGTQPPSQPTHQSPANHPSITHQSPVSHRPITRQSPINHPSITGQSPVNHRPLPALHPKYFLEESRVCHTPQERKFTPLGSTGKMLMKGSFRDVWSGSWGQTGAVQPQGRQCAVLNTSRVWPRGPATWTTVQLPTA